MLNRCLLLYVLALTPFIAKAQSLPAYPFVHISGTGSTNVFPDIGEINFEIVARDADPAQARSVVDGRITEIRDVMAQAGLPAEGLEIRDVTQELKKGQDNVDISELRCSIKIIVRDLTKWRQVLGPLLGKSNLDGFVTSFDFTKRAEVEQELMSDAIKTARRRGESMATGFGRKLGPVSAASSGELKNVSRALNLTPNDMGYNTGKHAAQDPADLLLITSIKLMQQVDVIFKLL